MPTLPDVCITVAWISRSTFAFKSEVPKHLAWSSDASLLAVTFDSCISLYEPVTYTQLAVLRTQEPVELSSAHFVGPSGKYLVVAAKGCVLLWDVITQQGNYTICPFKDVTAHVLVSPMAQSSFRSHTIRSGKS
jgi:hypothetical protein